MKIVYVALSFRQNANLLPLGCGFLVRKSATARDFVGEN